ncbi:UPF0175 family protein [Candidatus Woesearchaeota archaeon]|nr:UPF0175 family protein [Candidatus Woesearchaeota archaeon]
MAYVKTDLGKVYFVVREYRDGRVSVGKAAQLAGLSVGEMLDLLAELGIEAKLDVADYLAGAKRAEAMVK